MADEIKGEEDRFLESVFAAPSLADDGFSTRVVRRVRRRMWLRRITLPVATLIGLAISFKPLTELVAMTAGLVNMLPLEQLGGNANVALQQAPMVALGAMLLGACMLGLRLLED